MEDFHESISQVKDLSELLGQASVVTGDEVTDEELDAEFGEQVLLNHHREEEPLPTVVVVPQYDGSRKTEPAPVPISVEQRLVLPAALH
jgi:hypothetical protein